MKWPAIAAESSSGVLKGVLRSGASVSTIATIFSGGQTKCGTPILSPGLVIMIGLRSGGSAVP